MRRLILLVYLLHFLVAADSYALVPLVPTFAHRLGLSVVGAGALVAAPALAMILLSLPIGLGSDRVGARRLTIAAAALLAASAVGQALARSYALLLVSWVSFGIAYAIVYTACPAWIAAATGRRRTAALGGIGTVSGLGIVAGPAFGGLVADRFGVATPFLAIAVCSAVVALGLLRCPPARGTRRERRGGDALRALRERHAASALALMLLLGAAGGVVNLLVPLRLHAVGLGAGAIGLAFTSASVVFALTSGAVARLGDRVPVLRASALATMGLACTFILPVLAQSRVAVLSFLVLRAPLWAIVSTLSYPLCVVGAWRAGIGAGLVVGLGNVMWGIGTFVAPLAGGALAGAVGDRPVFALLALSGAAAGCTILWVRTRPAAVAEGAT